MLTNYVALHCIQGAVRENLVVHGTVTFKFLLRSHGESGWRAGQVPGTVLHTAAVGSCVLRHHIPHQESVGHVWHVDPRFVRNDRVSLLEPGVGGGWHGVTRRALKEGDAPFCNGQVLRGTCETPESCRWYALNGSCTLVWTNISQQSHHISFPVTLLTFLLLMNTL